jgi:SARP family transcriptional regulator, regulator of embCAB operon
MMRDPERARPPGSPAAGPLVVAVTGGSPVTFCAGDKFEFNVLGPLELRSAGNLQPLLSHFQAILLIALLESDERLVSVDALMNELWGGGHPGRPVNALEAHVPRLRRSLVTLDPERLRSRLERLPTGYRFISDDELDGRAFLREVAAVALTAPGCPPPQVAGRLVPLLALWRGPVFGGITGGEICQAAACRYDDARHRALELLFAAELARGNHASVIPELSALAATPSLFQERYCAQLMIALYRGGRQADALSAYRRMRDQLSKHGTGLRPGDTLQRCERAILDHDPALGTAQWRGPRATGR